MIQKTLYFAAFFIFTSSLYLYPSYSPKTPPSSQTPHPSIHSDETNSSSVNTSKSTALVSVSSRSRTPSPEPRNPNTIPVQEICDIINVDPESLLQEAQAFNRSNQDPKELLVLKTLLELGIKCVIPIKLTPDDATGAPVGYTPSEIIIRNSFWNKGKTEQEIILAQIVNRLNSNASEIQALAYQQLEIEGGNCKQFQALKRAMIRFCTKLDKAAIAKLIKQAYDKNDLEKVYQLQVYLTHIHTSDSESEAQPSRSTSPSPTTKRLKTDPACHQ